MPAATDIGIDLGTSTIVVYVKGKGIILREPALAAFDKDKNMVVAFGDEALNRLEHNSGNLLALHPLKGGVISDFLVTEKMLQYFIQKSMGHFRLFKPHIVLCIPSGVTEIEKRAVEEAAYQAGARDVVLVPEPVAAAMGAGIDVLRPSGSMVVSVGGGITEIAVISLAGIVVSQSIQVGGDSFDQAVLQYVRDVYGLFIGEQTAEEIKIHVGTADREKRLDYAEIRGRDIHTGTPRTISMTSGQVREAVEKPVRQIADAVHAVLERTPPDLAADIAERGILLAGGGAQLNGLTEVIHKDTGIAVMLAENPETAVARGTGVYIRNINVMDKTYHV